MNDTEILLKDSDIFYEFFSTFDSNKENDYNINEKEIKNLLKVKISKKRNREKNNDNDIEYIKKEKLKKNAESARRTR
jgi:isopentenyldiphosphate isomerase